MEHSECPSCGGSGGGPFGRPGSAWDTEDYVCPRCKGMGWIAPEEALPRPGLRKAATADAPDGKKSASQR
jgi:hypothetical protein